MKNFDIKIIEEENRKNLKGSKVSVVETPTVLFNKIQIQVQSKECCLIISIL
jgi:hypothetical protein